MDEIIQKFYKDLNPEQIQNILEDADYGLIDIDIIKQEIEKYQLHDEHKQKRRLYSKERALKNPIKYKAAMLYNAALNRAKKNNLSFQLTIDWIESKLNKGKCEATGIDFDMSCYNDKIHEKNPYSPSLDRIDPNKGYTENNTQVVLTNYNMFKCTARKEDTIKIARALLMYNGCV